MMPTTHVRVRNLRKARTLVEYMKRFLINIFKLARDMVEESIKPRERPRKEEYNADRCGEEVINSIFRGKGLAF